MLKPIRIRPRRLPDSLHRMSRINFAKLYNVEHNIKVYDFGDVDAEYVDLFRRNFEHVWNMVEEE